MRLLKFSLRTRRHRTKKLLPV